MAKHYPIHVEIKVHITDGRGQDGEVNYGFAMNRLPKEEDMPKVLEKAMSVLPDGFRLMTRHESMMHYLRSEKGYRGPSLAMHDLDAGDQWYDPETASTYSDRFFNNDDKDEE